MPCRQLPHIIPIRDKSNNNSSCCAVHRVTRHWLNLNYERNIFLKTAERMPVAGTCPCGSTTTTGVWMVNGEDEQITREAVTWPHAVHTGSKPPCIHINTSFVSAHLTTTQPLVAPSPSVFPTTDGCRGSHKTSDWPYT